ncbi:MAG TPA: extracellular solute-binding protein [Ktedonobacterales bacterium]|nr:extracellular solute-binding protein [Ktedonobacterales bacterium]
MAQTKSSRRDFLIQGGKTALTAGIAVGVLGDVLAACGTATSSSGNATTGTVTFWHAYSATGPENKALVGKVIPAFNKKYPKITVKAQDIPYDSMLQKITASLAGGKGPDVIRSDIIWMPQLAKIGALVKLDDIVTKRREEFFPGPLATCSYKGHYYGLPLDTNTRVIYYNKELFQRASISSLPTTSDEFTAAAAKIHALGGNIFGYAEGGLSGWNLLPWIWSFGGNVTDDQFSKASGYINNAQSVAALQYLVGLLDAKYLSPSILGGSSLAPSDALGKNQAGMIIDGPWMAPIFQGAYPKLQYGMGVVPTGPGGQSTSVVGGEDIAILQSSKNIEAAKTFATFMTSEEAQVLMGQTGQMPVLKAAGSDSSLPSYFSIFNQQLQTAKPRTVSPNWQKIDAALTDAFNKAMRHQKTPKAALDAAATQIDSLLV